MMSSRESTDILLTELLAKLFALKCYSRGRISPSCEGNTAKGAGLRPPDETRNGDFQLVPLRNNSSLLRCCDWKKKARSILLIRSANIFSGVKRRGRTLKSSTC